jgi:hypothetical protein
MSERLCVELRAHAPQEVQDLRRLQATFDLLRLEGEGLHACRVGLGLARRAGLGGRWRRSGRGLGGRRGLGGGPFGARARLLRAGRGPSLAARARCCSGRCTRRLRARTTRARLLRVRAAGDAQDQRQQQWREQRSADRSVFPHRSSLAFVESRRRSQPPRHERRCALRACNTRASQCPELGSMRTCTHRCGLAPTAVVIAHEHPAGCWRRRGFP